MGLVKAGETPLEAARRELVEETGHRPDSLTPLTAGEHPSPAGPEISDFVVWRR
ncbi:MAG TPA: NUDIX domain-containing protein [Mycobacteriales bacterium]|nr:NUDIX domain-containing protein [Mycobacteriales bacterium]